MHKYLNPKTYYSYLHYHTVGKRKASYAQCGEDIIISYLLKRLGVKKPFYIDIGAHDPIILSNTYLLYKHGAHGICIEPNPHFVSLIKRKRPRDLVLQVGMSSHENTKTPFYVMSSAPHSTFSKEDADHYVQYGSQNIKTVIDTPLVTPQSIIDRHVHQKINLISIDVEGLDFEIVKSFDFSKNRPDIFCIETIEFEGAKTEYRSTELISYMESKGYLVYADTHLNTIFVDKTSWENRVN